MTADRKPLLLIVDDEKTQREGLRAVLEDTYEVYLAEDSESATGLLKSGIQTVTAHTGIEADIGYSASKRIHAAAHVDGGIEQPSREETTPSKTECPAKSHQWMCMFDIRLHQDRTRKPESDLLQEVALYVAATLLRDHVTMPADPSNAASSMVEASTGGTLPLVSCACRGCSPAECRSTAAAAGRGRSPANRSRP